MTRETHIPFYDSAKQKTAWPDELSQTLHYIDLIVHLVKRDITTRYKRSVLGIAQTMLNPLGMIDIMTAVFSNIFHTMEGYTAFRAKCLERIRAFQRNGVTTLYVTHSIAEAEKTRTRAAWLDHECLRCVGNTQEAVDLYLNRVPIGVLHS